MRLHCVEDGQPLKIRAIGVVTALLRAGGERRWPKRWDLPDVVKVSAYRPELFGASGLATTQAVMRGPSEWSVGQRELFAAFVSAHNHCPF